MPEKRQAETELKMRLGFVIYLQYLFDVPEGFLRGLQTISDRDYVSFSNKVSLNLSDF